MTNRSPKSSQSRKLEQAQSGTARAALLGISDGLVTNTSLILGVTGAGASLSVVRLAGIASLIAGAFSMAVGEYISMRGQVELLQSVLKTERDELERQPGTVHHQLEHILKNDGVSQTTAHQAALEISRDADKVMSVYARGKLGLNPEELGAAWGSAVSSFVMFSAGALVPLLPWLVSPASKGLVQTVSIGLSVLAALGIGVYLGLATNGNVARSALRQLGVLILAAGATYLVGRLFHAPAI